MTIERENLLRERIITEARKFLDVPFVHQGRTPSLGLDCIGLIVCALRNAGYRPINEESFNKSDYSRIPKPIDLLSCLQEEAFPIPCAALPYGGEMTYEDCALPGDILLMAYKPENQPRHLAMVTGITSANQLSIIHTNSSYSCVKEHIVDPLHRQYIVALFRLRAFGPMFGGEFDSRFAS